MDEQCAAEESWTEFCHSALNISNDDAETVNSVEKEDIVVDDTNEAKKIKKNIASCTTGAGFWQVPQIFIRHLLKVCSKSLSSLFQVYKKSLTTIS